MQNLRKLLFPFLFFLFGFFLPSQLGKHFWPPFAFVSGIRTDYLAPTIYLTDLLLLLLVIRKLIDHPRSLILPKKLILLSAVWFLLYLYLAPIKLLFLYRIWQYAKIVITAFIFYKSSEKDRRWFFYGLGISLLYTLILVLSQVAHQGSIQGIWWFLGERRFSISTPGISTISLLGQKIIRGYGTFSHPNSLAGFAVLTYALFTIYNLQLFILPTILLLLLTFSKTGIIIFVALFLFIEYQKKLSCKICRVVKLLFGMWILFLLFLFHGSAGTPYERISGWSYAINVALQHPFGLSLGNYLYHGQPIHNGILLLLTEIGLIGLIGPIGLISLIKPISLIRLIRLIRFKEILLILIILITGIVDHYWLTLQQNMLLLGVSVGLIIARLQSEKIPHLKQY